MSRHSRVFAPGISAHVIQKGNNGADIFRRHPDYEVFLAILGLVAAHRRVAVHGYVLMTTHVHLIVTPDAPDTLPQMMKDLGSRYVRYFNRLWERTGTLWNGRYRSFPIETERYWLTCLRYIEQNPVRAGMVSTPDEYRWSSSSAHAFGNGPSWLALHRVYEELGTTADRRQIAYRALCGAPLT